MSRHENEGRFEGYFFLNFNHQRGQIIPTAAVKTCKAMRTRVLYQKKKKKTAHWHVHSHKTHNINIIISRGRYRSGPHTRGPIFGSPFPDNKKWHYFLINGRVKYAKTSDACSNCVSFFFVSVSPLSSSSHLTYRITYVVYICMQCSGYVPRTVCVFKIFESRRSNICGANASRLPLSRSLRSYDDIRRCLFDEMMLCKMQFLVCFGEMFFFYSLLAKFFGKLE